MITEKEKRILDYVYGQAENCMAFLRENNLVGAESQVGFTVARGSRYIDVGISYFNERGLPRRIVSRTSNKWMDKAEDREVEV